MFGCEPVSYLQIAKSCFTKYSEYIEVLLFNFISTTTNEERKFGLEELLDETFCPTPRLSAEYVTLNISTIMEKVQLKTSEAIWYELLTDKQYYENCTNVNEFALRFLTRTFNECTVETQVSAINAIETSSRRLKHEQAERLSFISTNGPHPLVSLKVVEDALNLHFEGKKMAFSS